MDRDPDSSQVPDLGPVPTRLSPDVGTVRRLVAGQFPQWRDLPVRPVDVSGWDNHTVRLGDDLVVRLPSAAEYALAVEKEHRWLPVLAERLPLPVPVPLALGEPSHEYPYPWSVYRWLPGVPVSRETMPSTSTLADDLAGVLCALRAVDPAHGPRPGLHNWFRGGTLRTYDAIARSALARLAGQVDVRRAERLWDAALAARWDGVDTWFHGDLAPGNLLQRDGRLCGVIDFGTCGVGDPSCDLAIAWSLLDPPERARFRTRLGVPDDEWARGRGWALWKALSALAGAADDGGDDLGARHVVESLLADDGR